MITLTEEEIQCIKQYVEDMKEIPTIEGIYLGATRKPIYRKGEEVSYIEIIYVTAINNRTGLYRNQLLASGIRLTTKDMDEIDFKVQNMRLYYLSTPGNRLMFNIDRDDNYSVLLNSVDIVSAETALTFGTILFDRFNNLAANKEQVIDFLRPFMYTAEITNIDEVLGNQKSI